MIFYWHSGNAALIVPGDGPLPAVIKGSELRAMGYAWDDVTAARTLPRLDTSALTIARQMPRPAGRRR